MLVGGAYQLREDHIRHIWQCPRKLAGRVGGVRLVSGRFDMVLSNPALHGVPLL